jgi:hypothetical protein
MREKVEERNTIRKEAATEAEVQVQTTYTGKRVEAEQVIEMIGQMTGKAEDFKATVDQTVEAEVIAGRIHGGRNSATQE